MSKRIVKKIGDQLADHARIRAVLIDQYDLDAETLADTLEGATDLPEALLAAAEQIGEYDIMLAGLTEYIAGLTARKSRLTRSKETLRTVILQAMDKADIETVTGPAMTLTARTTPAQPIIMTESDIPSRFFTSQPPTLDKKALGESLRNKEAIPGATLSNGGLSLAVRVK